MDNDNTPPQVTLKNLTGKQVADARSDTLATIDQVRDEVAKGRFIGVSVHALTPSGGMVSRVCGIMPLSYTDKNQKRPLDQVLAELRGAQN